MCVDISKRIWYTQSKEGNTMHTTFVHCLNRSFDALEKAKKAFWGEEKQMKTKHITAMLLTATLLLIPVQAAEDWSAVCIYCDNGYRLPDKCGGMLQNHQEIPVEVWSDCQQTGHTNCKTITISGYTVARCTERCNRIRGTHPCYKYHTNSTNIELCKYDYSYQ